MSFLSWSFKPWVRWVGLRYLRSKKGSRFLSFITLLSVLGIAVGVSAMIVVLSVMDGFEGQLIKRLMATELHVLVEPTEEVPGYDQGWVPSKSLEENGVADEIRSRVEVKHLVPVLATEAILRTGTRVSGVVVRGVPASRMELLKQHWVESQSQNSADTADLPGVVVGKELAYLLDLLPGDRVTLISPTETEGPLEAVPRMKPFRVLAIYETGSHDQELQSVFTEQSNVESFVRKREVLTQWEIELSDFSAASSLASDLRKRLPHFRVRDWAEMNASLFASLKLERLAMFIVLAFTVIVASFNIVTTLTLMVLEKKREISILKAMGAPSRDIAAIFLWEGLLIGGLGVGLGVVVSIAVSWTLSTHNWIALPDFYVDRTLPMSFVPSYYFLVASCALVIVLLACVYPSRRAAQLNPIEGIRVS